MPAERKRRRHVPPAQASAQALEAALNALETDTGFAPPVRFFDVKCYSFVLGSEPESIQSDFLAFEYIYQLFSCSVILCVLHSSLNKADEKSIG